MIMPPVAVLAGGLAMRLRPVTAEVPKSLIEVAGQPFIFHQLRTLRDNHINRAVLCVGYQGEMIREAVGDGSAHGLHIDYSFDGQTPLGTGGALKKALPLLPEEFFVLYGDSYLLCNYGAVYRAFRKSRKPALMTVFMNSGKFGASNVIFSNEMVSVYDKRTASPDMQYIDYGLSVLRQNVLIEHDMGSIFDLEYLYAVLVKEGRMAGYEVKNRFYEIGSHEGLAELRKYLSNKSETIAHGRNL